MATVALSYDDNGANGAPAYVFIHGWTCDRSFFAPQYDYFGSTHRAVAVDLRGHGDSPVASDGEYTIPLFAQDVAALLDELGLTNNVVVGHSLGGVITCQLAASRPDLVACAVMVDPAPFVPPAALQAAIIDFFRAVDEPTRARMVDSMFLPTDDSERKAAITRVMAMTPHEIAQPAIASLTSFDGPSALRSVQCPIASVGADNPYNDVQEMKRLNEKFMAGQTLGAGHFNQLEVPDQVNAMIDQFTRISL